MTRPIIDAGPGLNFFSANLERLLITTVGPLSAPETVRDEIERKARQDRRFAPAARTLRKLNDKWLSLLSDDITPELAMVVERIERTPMAERMRHSKDLGELMVVAHAVLLAEAGQKVTVIIDEKAGQRMAQREALRLRNLKSSRQPSYGSISLVNTEGILIAAARNGDIADRGEMRTIYSRLRPLDGGLVPIEATKLLSAEVWNS